MGDRGQVHIEDTGVYLYTHWGATELPYDVQRAIQRRERWDDDEYLTRMIFSEMVKGDIDGSTGYGIGSKKHGDVWRVVTVNVTGQRITINEPRRSYTFDEFANADLRVDLGGD